MIFRQRITIKAGEYEYMETIFTRIKHDPDELIRQWWSDDCLRPDGTGINKLTNGDWIIPQHMNEPIKSLEDLVS